MYHVLKISCSRFRHPQPRISKAFTLIELLVVVSIIALLVAILVPAVQQARDAAESVVCQSSLHQIGIATQLYVEDNDGSLFWQRGNSHWPDDRGPEYSKPWYFHDRPNSSLGPYMGDTASEVARHGCPTNVTTRVASGDYFGNRDMLSFSKPPYTVYYPPPCKLAAIRQPADKFLILEGVTDTWTADGFYYANGYRVGAPHEGNNNILWADMHVAPMLKADFMMSSTLIDPSFLYPDD